jgi:uncharacterized protein YndB with AHSA1/START domain
MNTESKKGDLVVSRVLDAPVEQVWKAWTDPGQVMRWWGPKCDKLSYQLNLKGR